MNNENKWLAICLATALAGVVGMGYMANKGYDAGRSAGVVEGQSDVIWELGNYSINCAQTRDANDNPVANYGNDCKTIYNTFRGVSERFGYANHTFSKGDLRWDKLFGNRS